MPAVNPFTLGQLVYLFEMATIASGWLAGIDPFGQPAIERTKELTFGLMGRPGFEAHGAEIEAWLARKDPRVFSEPERRAWARSPSFRRWCRARSPPAR